MRKLFAKNSKDKVSQELDNKNMMEGKTMTEKDKKTVPDTDGGEDTEKKPAAKKAAGKKEEKPGLIKRGKNWCKRHKEGLLGTLFGFLGGAGTAYGAAKIGEGIANRRNQQVMRDNNDM